MFVNVPLAKESHMVKSSGSRWVRGKNRLYLLMESDSAVTFHIGLHFELNNVAIFINNLPQKTNSEWIKDVRPYTLKLLKESIQHSTLWGCHPDSLEKWKAL